MEPIPPRLTDLTGRRFGKWTVLGYAGKRGNGKQQSPNWTCRCDCGRERPVDHYNLLSAKSVQCWACGNAPRVPGTGTPERVAWHRLADKCDRWASFEAFLVDVGPRPSSRHCLLRRTPDGPYDHKNSGWGLPAEQRSGPAPRLIEYRGLARSKRQWAEFFGVSRQRMYQRLDAFDVDEALFFWQPDQNPTTSRLAYVKKKLVGTGEQGRCNLQPRRGRRYTHAGHSYTVRQWAEFFGVCPNTIRQRLERMPIAQALYYWVLGQPVEDARQLHGKRGRPRKPVHTATIVDLLTRQISTTELRLAELKRKLAAYAPESQGDQHGAT